MNSIQYYNENKRCNLCYISLINEVTQVNMHAQACIGM